MGWTKKILRVDLSNGRIKSEPLNMEWARDYLGQRGLANVIELVHPGNGQEYVIPVAESVRRRSDDAWAGLGDPGDGLGCGKRRLHRDRYVFPYSGCCHVALPQKKSRSVAGSGRKKPAGAGLLLRESV